jgi:hypothetical protein
VDKYGRVRKVTDDNIIQHMRVVNSINEDKNTHSKYLMLIAFQGQQ